MHSSNLIRIRPWIALVVLASILITGCSTVPAEPTMPAPSPTPEPSATASVPPTSPANGVKVAASDVQRVTDPAVPSSDLEAVVTGHNDFAFELYQMIRDQEGNLFYAPYSISTALVMTYAGAAGNTATQMADVLNTTLPQDQLHPTMNAIAQGLMAQDTLTLTVANSLWAQEGYDFLETFLDTLARNYGAGVNLVDYIDPEAREAARQAINRWVEDETNGKIEDLIQEGVLTELTRLVLANAVYFKADWEAPFLNGTRDDTFTLLDGSEVTVQMMSRRANTSYMDGDGYQAIELPYEGDRMRMVVVVPAEGRFEEIEAAFDAAFAQQVIEGMTLGDAKLYMPKYSYEARLALRDVLIAMGMPDAFDPAKADFSGMDGTTQLNISRVEHKAFVAVDEEGTEAAAATGVVVEVESAPPELRVDRPFITFIYDAELDLVLFVGRVLNPAASE